PGWPPAAGERAAAAGARARPLIRAAPPPTGWSPPRSGPLGRDSSPVAAQPPEREPPPPRADGRWRPRWALFVVHPTARLLETATPEPRSRRCADSSPGSPVA